MHEANFRLLPKGNLFSLILAGHKITNMIGKIT